MKSIFFVAVFILLTITVSQPEKVEVKYVPLSVSVPHSFMQNDLSKDLSINFVPKADTNSYKIILNQQISKLVNSSNIVFPFSDCKLKQRPNISMDCKLSKVSDSSGLISLSVKPMLTLGQEKVDFYIIELSKLSASGESMDYQFFTKSRYVISGRDTLDFKVTKN